MLRYATVCPAFSTCLAADIISRSAYSTPLTFFETFTLRQIFTPVKFFHVGHVA